MSTGHPEKVIDALYAGNVQAVERYVDADNINLLDADGCTLLVRAVTATDPNMRMVRMLLKRGADASVRLREGTTLLHVAARALRKDLALALLRAGCDPNATNDHGQTALTFVLLAFDPRAELVELLLNHGADPGIRDGFGESAAELAARTGRQGLLPGR